MGRNRSDRRTLPRTGRVYIQTMAGSTYRLWPGLHTDYGRVYIQTMAGSTYILWPGLHTDYGRSVKRPPRLKLTRRPCCQESCWGVDLILSRGLHGGHHLSVCSVNSADVCFNIGPLERGALPVPVPTQGSLEPEADIEGLKKNKTAYLKKTFIFVSVVLFSFVLVSVCQDVNHVPANFLKSSNKNIRLKLISSQFKSL